MRRILFGLFLCGACWRQRADDRIVPDVEPLRTVRDLSFSLTAPALQKLRPTALPQEYATLRDTVPDYQILFWFRQEIGEPFPSPVQPIMLITIGREFQDESLAIAGWQRLATSISAKLPSSAECFGDVGPLGQRGVAKVWGTSKSAIALQLWREHSTSSVRGTARVRAVVVLQIAETKARLPTSSSSVKKVASDSLCDSS